MDIDKKRYLMELKALISFMDADEKAATLGAYSRLFEKAGESGEEQLIEELGSPVRLVLKLEKSYRSGTFADTLQELEDRIAAESEAVEEEIFETEAEEAPAEEPAAEEIIEEEPATEEESAETPLPVILAEAEETAEETEEPLEEPEEAEPYIEEIEEPADAEEILEEEPAPKVEEFPAWAGEAFDEESESGSEAPNDAESDEKTAAAEKKKPSAGAVILAVLCTPLLFVFAALMLVLALALSAVPGAVAALFGAVGAYFTGYALSTMQYIPDVLMVLGAGAICFGLALLFLNWTLRVLGFGVRTTFKMLSGSYGKLLGKEKRDEET